MTIFIENSLDMYQRINLKPSWILILDQVPNQRGTFEIIGTFLAKIQAASVLCALLFSWPFLVGAQSFAIPPKYDYASSFSEGLAIVSLGDKFCYINTAGKLIIPFRDYDSVYPFSEGYARVLKGKKFGFIDKSGRLVIDFKYGNASDFKDGLAVISYEDLSFGSLFTAKKGAVNKDGRVVINPYLGILFDFREGYGIANFGLPGDPTVGVLNKVGEVVIPGKFEYITNFHDGVAAALTSNNGWGLITPDGRWVSPNRFDGLTEFQEGLATFVDCGGKIHKPYSFTRNVNCRAGYIDKSGSIIIRPQFSIAEAFSDSRAAVSFSTLTKQDSGSFFINDPNVSYGYIDKTGLIVVEPIYKEARAFRDGVAAVKKSTKDSKSGEWGYINRDGKELTNFIFNYVGDYSDGLAPVQTVSGKWGYLKLD